MNTSTHSRNSIDGSTSSGEDLTAVLRIAFHTSSADTTPMSASFGPECDLVGNTNWLVACKPAVNDWRIRLSLSWKYALKWTARHAESSSL